MLWVLCVTAATIHYVTYNFIVCIIHYFIVIRVKQMLFASAMIHARFIDALHTQRPYPPEAEFPRSK